MKKIVNSLLFVLLIFGFYLPVQATSYPIKTMIPVDTTATVEAESFFYQDFVYNSAVDANGNGSVVFTQIVNHTNSKIPISINMLLFDVNQKNIGYLTYCTDRDFDSDYNKLKIESNQGIPFSIKVTSRYFSFKDEAKKEKYNSSDVKYVAVLDDNKYCKVGGYDNYTGKTLDQILKSISSTDSTVVNKVTSNNSGLIRTIIKFSVIAVFIIIGIFIIKMILEKLPKMSMPKINKNKSSKEDTSTKTGSSSDNNDNSTDNVIDLNYHGDVSLDDDNVVSAGSNTNTDVNDLFNISQGESITSDTTNSSSDNNNESNENEDDGESDLSKFFK